MQASASKASLVILRCNQDIHLPGYINCRHSSSRQVNLKSNHERTTQTVGHSTRQLAWTLKNVNVIKDQKNPKNKKNTPKLF